MAYDPNALSNITNASSIASFRYRPSELRDAGVRGSSRGLLQQVQPEIDAFNRDLGSAKQAAAEYAAHANQGNAILATEQQYAALASANPKNTGYAKAYYGASNARQGEEAAMQRAVKKISGGPAEYSVTSGGIDPVTGQEITYSTLVDPERKAIDLSGNKIKSKADAANAAVKKDIKRAAPSAGILAKTEDDEDGGNIEQAKGTQNIGSSLSKYRKQSIGAA